MMNDANDVLADVEVPDFTDFENINNMSVDDDWFSRHAADSPLLCSTSINATSVSNVDVGGSKPSKSVRVKKPLLAPRVADTRFKAVGVKRRSSARLRRLSCKPPIKRRVGQQPPLASIASSVNNIKPINQKRVEQLSVKNKTSSVQHKTTDTMVASGSVIVPRPTTHDVGKTTFVHASTPDVKEAKKCKQMKNTSSISTPNHNLPKHSGIPFRWNINKSTTKCKPFSFDTPKEDKQHRAAESSTRDQMTAKSSTMTTHVHATVETIGCSKSHCKQPLTLTTSSRTPQKAPKTTKKVLSFSLSQSKPSTHPPL